VTITSVARAEVLESTRGATLRACFASLGGFGGHTVLRHSIQATMTMAWGRRAGAPLNGIRTERLCRKT
jgi:hypothetical protein